MPRMKGADVITEFPVDSKIAYLLGTRGHGHVCRLNSFYAVPVK